MNGAFSKIEPRLQLVWDSTSIGLLKDCPRKYYFTMICNKAAEPNFHLLFGIWYHSTLETYDIARCEGLDHEAALRKATRRALTDTWIDNAPWVSGDSNKTRETLVRSIIWYLEEFKDNGLVTHRLANGKPAVELSFKFQTEFNSVTGEHYFIAGHLDRVVEQAGVDNSPLFVMDRKTTKTTISQSYFQQFSPNTQMSNYTLAGHVILSKPIAGIIIDAAQVAVTFTRFQRGMTHRTKSQLEEWLRDLQIVLRQNEEYVMNDYWPMNDKACFLCGFKSVCATAPETRQLVLDTFPTRVWDPTIARG